jgi:hypothetical protein
MTGCGGRRGLWGRDGPSDCPIEGVIGGPVGTSFRRGRDPRSEAPASQGFPKLRGGGAADGDFLAIDQRDHGSSSAPLYESDRRATNPPRSMDPPPFLLREERDGLRQLHAQQGRAAIGVNPDIMVLRLNGVNYRPAQLEGQPGLQPGTRDLYGNGGLPIAYRKTCLKQRHNGEHTGDQAVEAINGKLASEESNANREGRHGQRTCRQCSGSSTHGGLRPGRHKPSDTEASKVAAASSHTGHHQPVAEPGSPLRSLCVKRANARQRERQRQRSKKSSHRSRRQRHARSCTVHDAARPFTTFEGVEHGPHAMWKVSRRSTPIFE